MIYIWFGWVWDVENACVKELQVWWGVSCVSCEVCFCEGRHISNFFVFKYFFIVEHVHLGGVFLKIFACFMWLSIVDPVDFRFCENDSGLFVYESLEEMW